MSANRHYRGRGSASNPESRFARCRREALDDGWSREIEELPAFETMVRAEQARSIISRNRSPDVSFEQSINPYRGCEHGCVYCFTRPSHSYLDLSPGVFSRALSSVILGWIEMHPSNTHRGQHLRRHQFLSGAGKTPGTRPGRL